MSEIRKYTNIMLKDSIDESILEYIKKYINLGDSDVEKAIIIYIKLCELFWYDPIFVIDNDYELVDDLSSISVDNNEVICLHWAIIYSRLLDKYGVSNELLGDDSHLKVKVITEQFIMFADATKYGVEYRDYMLSDLTNTKLGFRINNLATLSSERNKELNVIIEGIYQKLGMPCYDISKIDNLVEKFRLYCFKRLKKRKEDGNIVVDKMEINRRITFINRFYHIQKGLHEVEKLQIFSKYYKKVFEGFNFDTCRCLTMCEQNKDISGLLKLIVVTDDLGENYYFLETEYGFAEFNKIDLIHTLIERNIYFKYDRCGILGFTDNEVKKLIK